MSSPPLKFFSKNENQKRLKKISYNFSNFGQILLELPENENEKVPLTKGSASPPKKEVIFRITSLILIKFYIVLAIFSNLFV